MQALAASLSKYFLDVTGKRVELIPMPPPALPFHLERQYAFYTLKLSPITLTVIVLREPETFSPSRFQQHLKQLFPSGAQFSCIVAANLPGYVRKRLIETEQAFVVPGVQMYLPMLGEEHRKRSQAARVKLRSSQSFSPVTQALLLYWLQGKLDKAATLLALSNMLGYSAMSMSRAVSELETAGIAKVQRVGKERLMSIVGERRVIWEQALPFLRRPFVQAERIHLHDVKPAQLLLAGESALARLSLLSEPATDCYAVSKVSWQVLAKAGIERIPVEEPGTCLLQIWIYDPSLLTKSDMVDPFSLYLSLQDDPDERIEQALDALMERTFD